MTAVAETAARKSPRPADRDAAQRLAEATLIVLALIIATRAGTHFLMVPYASIAWPPTGIALALMLRFGRRVWPAVILGTALGDALLLENVSRIELPFVIAAGSLYPALAAALLTILGFRIALDRVRDVVSLLLVSIIAGCVTAVIALFGPILAGETAVSSAFSRAWSSWVAGGVMGTIVFAPVVLTWSQRRSFDLRPRSIIEAVVVYSALIAASLADFGGFLSREGEAGPSLYAIFPFVIWAALRFGPRGAALAHLIASGIAIAATARGVGPFVRESLFTSLLYLHSFTLVVVTTSLLLAAALAERARTATNLKAILASITDPILVCDTNQRLTLSNPAFLRMFGLETPPSTITAALAPLAMRDASGKALGADDRLLARSLAGETLEDVERIWRDRATGHDVHVLVSSAPIVDSGAVVGAVSVSRDVTDRYELQRMRDEFLSVAAHELKTPLTVQKAAVQALLRRAGADASARSRLEAINRGVTRMSRIVEDMLDVSLLEHDGLALHLSAVDLSHLVRQCVNAFVERTRSHPFVVTGPDSIVVRADSKRTEQVLARLLENAVAYSLPQSPIEIDISANEHSGIVSVRDHGVGIPSEKQARIFERFYRAHSGTSIDRGGLGLGLYLSRSMIERQGGTLSFRSEPERGSVFSFSVPRER